MSGHTVLWIWAVGCIGVMTLSFILLMLDDGKGLPPGWRKSDLWSSMIAIALGWPVLLLITAGYGAVHLARKVRSQP